MTRRMLINAQKPEELRIAIVSDEALENYQVQVAERGLTRGNIYRGVIASIQPSLNAAFIDYGEERHGFLAIQDVVPEAYYRKPNGKGRPRIDEVLERGKPIVVQVTREPEGQKGGALTTNLSLAGRYLVLTPFDETRGISRKVEDEDTRKALKQQVAKLDIPAGCGVIVRTNALEQNKTALNRDFSALARLWKRIRSDARAGGQRNRQAKLLYSDQDIVVQALRDYLDSSIQEVLVDDDAVYDKASSYMKAFMPRSRTKLIRYKERAPLFSGYKLERQIDRIYDRKVDLPSGGSIVIDRTEALTAIDVNSGRSTRAATQEETALHTNLEAAAEVARQLRLRDIGGLLVVDFIDMRASRNQRKVEKALRDEMKADKARVSLGRISRNGLLEINRQRIHQALDMRTHRTCPTCDGTGRIASPEMVGLNLLRRIEARAASGPLKRVVISLHPELADAFQNGRRHQITDLEREFAIRIEVIAATHLHRHEQEVEWMQRDASAPVDPRPSQAPRASDADSKPSPKRSRGRRRSPKADNGETAQDKAAKPRRRRKAADADGNQAAAEPTAKRSRGRGRRRASGAKTETQDQDAVQENQGPGRDGQGNDGPASDSKPPRRSRSRGRRRRRSADSSGPQQPLAATSAKEGGMAHGNDPPAGGDPAANGQPSKAQGSNVSDAGQENRRPRRRRSRRRGRRPPGVERGNEAPPRVASDKEVNGNVAPPAPAPDPPPPSEFLHHD
ncbi:MAG: Rne/Rng family ribonuclease [Acidobacteriota bacterium]